MPNSLTWCDLPEDVSLWPGLPLSLSGDEVMPLDYHAGRSGWLLYGRGLNKRRLTDWQRELGAALVIVASWVVEDYQVIRLAGSLMESSPVSLISVEPAARAAWMVSCASSAVMEVMSMLPEVGGVKFFRRSLI